MQSPIGIFDSGYGGLTVFRAIADLLPQYDYIYLGDNARAPYGNRSFDTVYEYTLECIYWLFEQGCPLIIVACNTASAKALRSIQQKDLPNIEGYKRVLGVIRPTSEVIGDYTKSKHIGILATSGTVLSQSYELEIQKSFPDIKVYQQACPLWVPFVESNEYLHDTIDAVIEHDIQQLLEQSPKIDTVLLACTHYPLLENKIRKFLPNGIVLLSQGSIVANSLKNYLVRHPEMYDIISLNNTKLFYTTDNPQDFEIKATQFFGEQVVAHHTDLGRK